MTDRNIPEGFRIEKIVNRFDDDSDTYDYRVFNEVTGEEVGIVRSARTEVYSSDTTTSRIRYGYRGAPKRWSWQIAEIEDDPFVSNADPVRRGGSYIETTRKAALEKLVDAYEDRREKLPAFRAARDRYEAGADRTPLSPRRKGSWKGLMLWQMKHYVEAGNDDWYGDRS